MQNPPFAELDNVLYDHSVLWQMSPSERLCFVHLVDKLCFFDESTALEIGTYCGGSLRSLCRSFDKVYSLDVDFKNLKVSFENCVKILGDSKRTLPKLVEELNSNGDVPDFILIDGDHEYETVKHDLSHTLQFRSERVVHILIHDSWYPPSRKAIIDVAPQDHPLVDFVDLDFCNGNLLQMG